MASTHFIVFSDLDGTLLNHHSYTCDEAMGLLRDLEEHHIPVILASSKTFAEMQAIRSQLGNRHPFICENGAQIVIPGDYFEKLPAALRQSEQYLTLPLCRSRGHWRRLIGSLSIGFCGQFKTFASLGTEGIMEVTGLSKEDAERANKREFSEPVLWLGDDASKRRFIERIEKLGAVVQQGGRFLSVSGDVNKGKAMSRIMQCYVENHHNGRLQTIALGDSENDLPMLSRADHRVVIPSPARKPLEIAPESAATGLNITSTQYAPEGWTEGLSRVLQQLGVDWINSKEACHHG